MSYIFIIKVPFNMVQKMELPEIVDNTIQIVGKYDTEALYIDGMYRLLLAQQSNAQKLSARFNTRLLTSEISLLRKSTDSLVVSIMEKSRSLLRLSGVTEAAGKITELVNTQFHDYHRLNRPSKNSAVKQFLDRLETNTELTAAVDSTGMKVYVDELKVSSQSILSKTELRRVSSSEKVIADRKEMKKDIVNAISNLFKAIELSAIEHSDIDFLPLVTELNTMLMVYKSLVKSRATLNQKTPAKTETVAVTPTSSATAS